MAGKTSWLLLAIVTLVGAAVFYGAGHFWNAGRELREEGVTTQATVLMKSSTGSGDYRARIAFTDAAYPREVEIELSDRAWNSTSKGEKLDVSYIPGRPETTEEGPIVGHQLLGWFAAFFALAGGGMAATGLFVSVRAIFRGATR
jgi:hypothetical protein